MINARELRHRSHRVAGVNRTREVEGPKDGPTLGLIDLNKVLAYLDTALEVVVAENTTSSPIRKKAFHYTDIQTDTGVQMIFRNLYDFRDAMRGNGYMVEFHDHGFVVEW